MGTEWTEDSHIFTICCKKGTKKKRWIKYQAHRCAYRPSITSKMLFRIFFAIRIDPSVAPFALFVFWLIFFAPILYTSFLPHVTQFYSSFIFFFIQSCFHFFPFWHPVQRNAFIRTKRKISLATVICGM